MKYKFRVNKIYRDENGYYDYLKWRGDEERLFESDNYFAIRDEAIATAGCLLDSDGGLCEVIDENAGNAIYVHFNGFSGEITLLYSVSDLRKHLKKLNIKILNMNTNKKGA